MNKKILWYIVCFFSGFIVSFLIKKPKEIYVDLTDTDTVYITKFDTLYNEVVDSIIVYKTVYDSVFIPQIVHDTIVLKSDTDIVLLESVSCGMFQIEPSFIRYYVGSDSLLHREALKSYIRKTPFSQITVRADRMAFSRNPVVVRFGYGMGVYSGDIYKRFYTHTYAGITTFYKNMVGFIGIDLSNFHGISVSGWVLFVR